MTPQEASLRGRIGAFTLHAMHDPRETTAKARQTFLDRFEREVDPEGKLPEVERQRRAVCARKAHFARLALRSAQVRRAGKRATSRTAEAPQEEQQSKAKGEIQELALARVTKE